MKRKKTLYIRMAALLCALSAAVFGHGAVFAEEAGKSEDIQAAETAEALTEDVGIAEASEKSGTGRILFLLYHDIAEGDTLKESDNPSWCTTAVKLESDIDALWSMGYRSLSCADYYRGNYDPAKDYFVLTFDDGYLSNYELLPDILEKTGTHADIFMCTECTNLPNHFKYSQGRKLEESGLIRLYSHYNEHVYINELKKDDLLRGLQNSFSYLDKRLGGRDRFFAYPNSSYSEETISLLCDFGVKLQFVQCLPPDSYTFDWRNSGLILRYTVAFDTDMAEAAGEYFSLLAGGEGTSADGEASENAEPESAAASEDHAVPEDKAVSEAAEFTESIEE